MEILVSTVERPNAADLRIKDRRRFCPACREKRGEDEFRYSERNPRLTKVCLFCRSSRFRSQRRFWAITELLEQIYKKKGVMILKGAVKNQAENYLKFPERVAAIVGKTFAVEGDDFKLEDDVALTRIRDLLNELDPTLIPRNRKKKLSR